MGVSNDLLALSDDQLQTQFSLEFPKGIPGGGNSDLITLRADTTFSIPELTTGTYSLFKKGVKIEKTNMVQETSKEISLEVRIDQQWEVVDAIYAWQKLCYNFETGTAGSEAVTRTDMYLIPEDTQNKAVKTIKFMGVKLKGFQIGDFDNQGGDPVRITMNMIFLDMDIE